MNDNIAVEWLQDIPRDQTVVYAGVLVLFQLRELLLPDVNHGKD